MREEPGQQHYLFTLCSNKVGVPGKTEGVIFCPVPVEVTYFEPERVGVETLNRTIATQNETGVAEMIPDLVHIKNMLSSIEEVVDRLLQYVQDVIVSEQRVLSSIFHDL